MWVGLHYGVSGPTREGRAREAVEHVRKCASLFQEGEQDCSHVVWMGDSNFVADTTLDRCIWDEGQGTYRESKNRDSSEYLHNTFLAHTEAQDLWVTVRMHGEKPGYTRQQWRANEGVPCSMSRIDHIFSTPKVADCTTKVGVALGANQYKVTTGCWPWRWI